MSNLSDFLASGSAFRIGTVADWKLDDGVAGWLSCDGTLHSSTTYPDLSAMMKDVVGAYDFSQAAISGVPVQPGAVRYVETSPDKKYVALCHDNGNGVTVLNTTDWSAVPGTPTLAGNGQCAAFSPDGQYLAVAHFSGNGYTVIDTSDWSVVPGTPALPGTSGSFSGDSVDFSPDGAFLAIGHNIANEPINGMTVVRVSDWSEVPIPRVSGRTYAVEFSPDCRYLAAGCTIGPVEGSSTGINIIDTRSWVLTEIVTTLDGARQVRFAPDGSFVAKTGSTFEVFDTADWSKIPGVSSYNSRAVRLTADGGTLLLGLLSSPYLQTYNTATWADAATTIPVPRYIYGMDLSGLDEHIICGLTFTASPTATTTVHPIKDYGPAGSFYVPDLDPVTYGNVSVQPQIKAEK